MRILGAVFFLSFLAGKLKFLSRGPLDKLHFVKCNRHVCLKILVNKFLITLRLSKTKQEDARDTIVLLHAFDLNLTIAIQF